MIPTRYLIPAALALSFSAGWIINGWRYQSDINEIKLEHAKILEASSMHALNSYNHMELVKNAAIKSAEEQSAKNASAAAVANSTVKRLRADITGLQNRIATASATAVAEYATTSGELFGVCTEEYQRMASKADDHATDARKVIEAWPVSN